MKRNNRLFLICACGILLQQRLAYAQERQEPGRSIGAISTQGELIVLTLDDGVLGKANLFDLVGHTLRFTRVGQGYRAENVTLQWDPDFGTKLEGPQVTLHNFAFPYSGKSWNSLSVGITGSISFGAAPDERRGGVSIGRFDQLADAARNLINIVPAICVFLKPRMSGTRYVKEMADRVVIMWDLTEPVGGIQDFTWVKTINRFQAVLRTDGTIEMSYDQVAAKDAIVGIYPLVTAGTERTVATIKGEEHPAVPAHLNIRNLRISVVDGLFLKVAFETSGPVLPEGDPALAGIAYRLYFDGHKPLATNAESAHADAVWTIRGFGARGRAGPGGGGSRYRAFGPGVSPIVKTNGNTISMQGIVPAALKGTHQFAVYADVQTPELRPRPSIKFRLMLLRYREFEVSR